MRLFKDREGYVRPSWILLGVLGTLYALYTLLFYGPWAVYLYLRWASGGDAGRFNELGRRLAGVLAVPATLSQELVMVAVPWFTWRKLMRRPLREMGLPSPRGHLRELAVGLLAGAGSIAAVFSALVLTGNGVVQSWAPNASVGYLSVSLLFYVCVGFAEEFLMRGFVMSTLRRTRRPAEVIALPAVLFALMHAGNMGFGVVPFVNITLVGLLFAYMYVGTGNIWMSIGYHTTWNYFQGCVFGLPVSGMHSGSLITTQFPAANLLNGGTFGPEGGLFVTAVLLAGFLVVRAFRRGRFSDFMDMGRAPQV